MVTPHLAQPRTSPSEPVTVFVTGCLDAEYMRSGARTDGIPMTAVRLSGGEYAYVPTALLVPGDIRPTLRQALLDAKECRRWRRQSPEAAGWVRQYEAALDVLGLGGES
jgi:hypothetical protein